MDSEVIADVIRKVDVLRARVERPIETPFWPVSGPEYTGRA